MAQPFKGLSKWNNNNYNINTTIYTNFKVDVWIEAQHAFDILIKSKINQHIKFKLEYFKSEC